MQPSEWINRWDRQRIFALASLLAAPLLMAIPAAGGRQESACHLLGSHCRGLR